ncbi:MAG: ABC transporter, permease protein (cluster 3, basic aa/glutamine/opines), partial [uncultured Nocardioidaceae bacterium]
GGWPGELGPLRPPGAADRRAAPRLHAARPAGGGGAPRPAGVADVGPGPVRLRAVGALRHPGLRRGAARRRAVADAADGAALGHLRRRPRAGAGGRQAVRARLGPVAVLGVRRVLPGRTGPAAHDLHLLHLRRRGRLRRLLVGGPRADPLQRLGARRGVPRRCRRGPRGPGRGGVRDRAAQVAGDDDRPAAAGGEDHAARDHQPDGRGVEGHQPRLLHHRARADLHRQADLPGVRQPAADRPGGGGALHRGQPGADLGRDPGPAPAGGRGQAARDVGGRLGAVEGRRRRAL